MGITVFKEYISPKITLKALKVHLLTDCYCKWIWLNRLYFRNTATQEVARPRDPTVGVQGRARGALQLPARPRPAPRTRQPPQGSSLAECQQIHTWLSQRELQEPPREHSPEGMEGKAGAEETHTKPNSREGCVVSDKENTVQILQSDAG